MKRRGAVLALIVLGATSACSNDGRAAGNARPVAWSSVTEGHTTQGYAWRLLQSGNGEHRCLGLVARHGSATPTLEESRQSLSKESRLGTVGECDFNGRRGTKTTRVVTLDVGGHTLVAGLVPAAATSMRMQNKTVPTHTLARPSGYADARYWQDVDVTWDGTFVPLGSDNKAIAFDSTI